MKTFIAILAALVIGAGAGLAAGLFIPRPCNGGKIGYEDAKGPLVLRCVWVQRVIVN